MKAYVIAVTLANKVHPEQSNTTSLLGVSIDPISEEKLNKLVKEWDNSRERLDKLYYEIIYTEVSEVKLLK